MFNTCEHQPLPLMHGEQMRLMIYPNAEPKAHHTPIPVPLHWQSDVETGLDQDVVHLTSTLLERPTTPKVRFTKCAPFPVAKRNVFSIAGTDIDIITPCGRYRYKTAPQGYIASGDGYSRCFDEIVSHIPDKTKVIGDTLLWADNLTASFHQAVKWLDICGRHGIILNPEKLCLAKTTLNSRASRSLSPMSGRAHDTWMQSVTSQHQLRSRTYDLGLVLSTKYHMLLPHRPALKPGTPFIWNEELNNLFNESKTVIVTEIEEGVRIFDKSKPPCLATDWSKSGIGFWLLQKHC
ncbi:Hypothetical predicted protein [Paramuricea clavata]|uniref:Uncharacterized protein n=1 Tax=Paramuricea clavata TaxID=317549 RepID=A0A6S7H5A3_PARCT|nr:Hypothetical predicted protein [Paramuricea clavata]